MNRLLAVCFIKGALQKRTTLFRKIKTYKCIIELAHRAVKNKWLCKL